MTPGQIAFLILVAIMVALITAAFFVDADDF